MAVKPYPAKDYRVSSQRSRWHPCTKAWVGGCKDAHAQRRGEWAYIPRWSQAEVDREAAKREAWYVAQRHRG